MGNYFYDNDIFWALVDCFSFGIVLATCVAPFWLLISRKGKRSRNVNDMK